MKELLKVIKDNIRVNKEAVLKYYNENIATIDTNEKVKLENIVIHLDLARDQINDLIN